MWNIEVDQEANLPSAQLQVSENLRGMQWQQFLHSLELDDDAIFNQEVDSIPGFELNAVVCDRQADLVLKPAVQLRKTRSEGRFDMCSPADLRQERNEPCTPHLESDVLPIRAEDRFSPLCPPCPLWWRATPTDRR